MIKFDGLIIIVEPDYKERIEKGIELEELTCKAYDEKDTECKNSLLDFILIPRTDFDDETVEEVEKAIRRTAEREWATIQLERANMKLERIGKLFKNSLTYIKEVTDPQNYEKVFREALEMTDDEIRLTAEKTAEEQNVEMNLS